MVENYHVPDVNGFYLGKVLRHESYGRCKIWIPGIHTDDQKEKPDELPDAVQVSQIFGGGRKGNGCFSYPNIDSVVVCFFINRDQNYPAYLGVLLDGKEANEEWDKVIPEIASKKPSKIHRMNSGQSYVEMSEDGQIIMESWSKSNENQHAKVSISKSGDINLESTGQIHISAPTITMDAGEQIWIQTPSFTNINSTKNMVVCDSINLNASNGMVNIQSVISPSGSPLI